MTKKTIEQLTKDDVESKIIDIYLFRHGESVANTTRQFIGGRASSSPLSRRGELQAVALGDSLSKANVKFDKVFSSTALRASQTARIALSTCFGYTVNMEVFQELEELDQGSWEGLVRKEIYTDEVIKEIKSNMLDFKPPEGESQREVGERIAKFINERILSQEPPFSVGIFFHGLAIKCWLQHIMEFKAEFIYPMEIDNCSMTRLRYNNLTKLWGLKCLNVCDIAWR